MHASLLLRRLAVFGSILPILALGACRGTDRAPLASGPGAEYAPERFEDDGRRAALLAARPAIDAVFRGNAEANHYVGQIWGVVVDGELLYFDTYGVANIANTTPVDEHTRFHIASLTKSFTCLAVLKLRDAGKLSLQDSVSKHLPELARSFPLTDDAPPIVVAQLMTMTSGLPEDNPWADRRLEDTHAELRELLGGGLSFSSVPGSAYEYSNLGYAMLGELIARVSGRSAQEYITQEILQPLGMYETVWDYGDVPEDDLALGYRWEDDRWKPEPMLRTGAYASIGGLITSLSDLARYASFHLGAWPARSGPDEGPVKRSTVREMHVPVMPRLDAGAVDPSGAPCPALVGYGYGLGVRIDCHGVRRISHTGGLPGFGTNIQLFPDHGVALISFANLTYAASSAQHNQVNATLFGEGGLQRRVLPPPAALAARAQQVAELVRTWDEALGDEILAANFYLDRSREHRMREAEGVLRAAGEIQSIGPVTPLNQLRGSFVMHGTERDVRITFTQSPESPPRVQHVSLRLL
jgi:CubicO group peptidase (beta-lactamase class C family)